MDRNDLQVDRRTLLRATSFLAAIPADVGVVWGAASGDDASSPGLTGGSDADATAPAPLDGYAYGGAPVVSGAVTTDAFSGRADDAAGDDPQGYGEYGYGGHVS